MCIGGAACVHYLVGKKSINRFGKCHSGLAKQEISKIYACCSEKPHHWWSCLYFHQVIWGMVFWFLNMFFSQYIVEFTCYFDILEIFGCSLLVEKYEINLIYLHISHCQFWGVSFNFSHFMQCVLTCELFHEITKFITKLSSFNISFLPVS